jgi:hypothetical protein
MARATYADLIVEVRAQIDASDDVIFGWLMDRSRVLNAEAAWLLKTQIVAADGASRAYPLPDDVIWIEAVTIGTTPYQRSTMHALDGWYASGIASSLGLYADGADEQGTPLLQIYPDVAADLNVRYVGDVPENRAAPSPFPPDFDEALVEGAIAIGLARMDERFDSAGYFDERFTNAVGRLRRRRNGHVGRGATKIRVFG